MKGAIAKEAIFNKLLEVFEGSFVYNSGKEVRIPYDENGNLVQIKVTLTCAKDNVEPEGGATSTVKKENAAALVQEEAPVSAFPKPKKPVEPTPEEKKNLEDLLNALGLNQEN